MLKLFSQTGWRFLWLALLTFVLDQYTKNLTVEHIELYQAVQITPFSLIIGGALGNAYDRLVLGHVVDFLVLYYQDWVWPAFNVADSAICLGAILLLIDMFKNKELKND